MTAKRNKDKSYVVRNIKQKQKFKYKLILEGVVVGILVGLVIAAFRLLLVKADHVRGLAVQLVKVRPCLLYTSDAADD